MKKYKIDIYRDPTGIRIRLLDRHCQIISVLPAAVKTAGQVEKELNSLRAAIDLAIEELDSKLTNAAHD